MWNEYIKSISDDFEFTQAASEQALEKTEAILIYLSFNLARGHLKAIINSLLIILGKNSNFYFQEFRKGPIFILFFEKKN